MLKEMFEKYGDEYIDEFRKKMPYQHIKVIRAIQGCKSDPGNIVWSRCDDCGKIEQRYCSCGNRNCPICQQGKGEEWLDKRLEKLLPGAHFMVTFTIPKELRDFMRTFQGDAYSIFFKAAAETLKVFIADKKYTNGDLSGFMGVLHTWGSQMQYHPHIHFIVAGGAINRKDKIWNKSPKGFLAPVHAMSKVFKGKFYDLAKKQTVKISDFTTAPLSDFINPKVKFKSYNVNSQYIKSGGKGALSYLAPYVFRPAISESRIISVKDGKVSFRCKKKNSKKFITLTLSIFDFIARFLQHVLPVGFMKVRYYGFMHGSCSFKQKQIIELMKIAYDNDIVIPKHTPLNEEVTYKKCDKCGGNLIPFMLVKNGYPIHISPKNKTKKGNQEQLK